MSQDLSFIEKMEYLHVLNETKKLLVTKLQAASDSQQKNLMEIDLQKINEELKDITGQNPELADVDTLNFVFPYYESNEQEI